MRDGLRGNLKRSMDFDPLMNQASQKGGGAPRSCLQSLHHRSICVWSPRLSGKCRQDSPQQILHNIKQEYKRLQKRRHLDSTFQQESSCCPLDLQNHSGSALPGTSSGASSPFRKEQPLFSLRQVGMICERLLKEREDKIREEYDEILTTKLAEQYDAFVKFTHDQLMRRFGEQPASYVS
ncbi:hypothetical protein F7725_019791 [Dissostichus mawsoni]|uniref:Akirin-2 n=1 Tax=Dissostichus mawsoni TaxID=36200 RepID=A0A7J5YKQ3_DISMA|nr:hypothetical protein F7725_019791 [Dissostichus mawsoni]